MAAKGLAKPDAAQTTIPGGSVSHGPKATSSTLAHRSLNPFGAPRRNLAWKHLRDTMPRAGARVHTHPAMWAVASSGQSLSHRLARRRRYDGREWCDSSGEQSSGSGSALLTSAALCKRIPETISTTASAADTREVIKKASEEADGRASGPFTPDELTRRLGRAWIPSRLGVRQGTKIRPSDDFTESLVNNVLTCPEEIHMDVVDRIGAVAKLWARLLQSDDVQVTLPSSEVLHGRRHTIAALNLSRNVTTDLRRAHCVRRTKILQSACDRGWESPPNPCVTIRGRGQRHSVQPRCRGHQANRHHKCLRHPALS